MALTATASNKTRQEVIHILGMRNPSINAISPHKSNIIYWVAERESAEKCFAPVIDKLKVHRCEHPRMIIYCSRYKDCSMLYRFFKYNLGDDFTEPKGAPDHSRLRLVDMFTSLTHSEVKKDISVINSPLRIVISYGMSIDCSNVNSKCFMCLTSTLEISVQKFSFIILSSSIEGNSTCRLTPWGSHIMVV